MFGFKTGARAEEEKKPAPRGTNQPKAVDPLMLGTGAAAAAGHKLKGRAAQIEAAIGYADGGKVTGPGTGTSDDIKAVIPEGSYIMPADSTEQIGEQNLAGMGSPVPVNLSNGEYHLPPEQVHALGVAVLNLLKGMTHKGGGHGFRAEDGELYFAGGGVTSASDDELRRQREQAAAGRASFMPNTMDAPATNAANRMAGPSGLADKIPGLSESDIATAQNLAGEAARGFSPVGRGEEGKPELFFTGGGPLGLLGQLNSARRSGANMLAGGVALPFAAGIDAARSGAVRLVGGDPNTLEGGANKYADAASSTLSQGAQGAGQIVDGFKAGARDVLGVQKATAANPAQAAPAATTAAQARTQPASAPAVPAAGGDLPTDTTPRANDITRVGNSFSGGSGGFQTVDQIQRERQQRQSLMADNLSAINGARAANADLHQTRLNMMDGRPLGWNPSQQQQVSAGSGSNWLAERERQNMINRVLTPHAGAQNRQLTMGQMRLAAELMQSGQVSEEARVREQGLADRAMLAEQGAAARSADSTALARQSLANDTRRLAGEEQARGFDIRARERIESLYEQHDKAKPEDRPAILEQIRILSGKDQPARYAAAQGGQEVDPITQQLVTRPPMLFNQQTGEVVQQQGAPSQAVPAVRPVGTRSTVNGKTAVWNGNQWIPQ